MISVVVPSYGGALRLPTLLNSLAQQGTQREWEVVVVLDGTPDNSSAVLDEWMQKLQLRVITLPKNLGRVSALNTGFAAARGDVLIRCDDDLEVAPNFVDRHAQWHASDGEVGVIGLTRNVMPTTRYATCYAINADQNARKAAYEREESARWMHWAANCSVRRRTWERIGPYDTAFRGYGWEDVDWGYRLATAGVRLVIDPKLQADHMGAATTARTRIERSFASGQARARFAAKHGVDAPNGSFVSTTSGRARLWSTLVRMGSHRTRLVTHARRGGVIDATIRVLPVPVARKLVAWGVEAAGEAGFETARSVV